jgi:hypothetical protein
MSTILADGRGVHPNLNQEVLENLQRGTLDPGYQFLEIEGGNIKLKGPFGNVAVPKDKLPERLQAQFEGLTLGQRIAFKDGKRNDLELIGRDSAIDGFQNAFVRDFSWNMPIKEPDSLSPQDNALDFTPTIPIDPGKERGWKDHAAPITASSLHPFRCANPQKR